MENYRNIVLSLILFLMGSLTAMAQNETLSGRVVEKGSGKAISRGVSSRKARARRWTMPRCNYIS